MTEMGRSLLVKSLSGARTSRRTFYEHFTGKDDCFVALLTANNQDLVEGITAAVDRSAPWTTQARQAIQAWINATESRPAVTVSWIRELPGLGDPARQLQRDAQQTQVAVMLASRETAIILIGGPREPIATTVENGDHTATSPRTPWRR